MNLRSLLNVVYAYVIKGRSPTEKEDLDRVLNAKRWVDMDEKERAREERRIMATKMGAVQGTRELVGALGLPQGRRRPA